MEQKTLAILITILLALAGVAGDFFIKLSGNGKKFIELRWFFIGMIIYAATAFGWFFVMKKLKLADLSVFYTISTVLFLTLVGTFYFKEKLGGYEIIGIILAVISVLLLKKFI